MVGWREKLRPVLAKWEDISMITLTVDQSRFPEGPEAAYRYLQKKRAVAELVKKLVRRKLAYSKKWCYVIEFHRKGGWVHYHVLVESGFIPHDTLEKLWGKGFVWITRSRSFESSDHAVNYATKYIAKEGETFPEWVLNFEGNLRRFSTSRGLCGEVQSRRGTGEGKKRETKKIADRISACGEKTIVLESAYGLTKYLATIDVCFSDKFAAMSENERVKLVGEALGGTKIDASFANRWGRINWMEFFRCEGLKDLTPRQQRIRRRLLEATRYRLNELEREAKEGNGREGNKFPFAQSSA